MRPLHQKRRLLDIFFDFSIVDADQIEEAVQADARYCIGSLLANHRFGVESHA